MGGHRESESRGHEQHGGVQSGPRPRRRAIQPSGRAAGTGNGAIYFDDTSGGNAGVGQVWEFRPDGDGGTLTLIFESPGAAVLDAPDNLAVSPQGSILLCEDGDDDQYMRGVTLDGEIFDFALNLAE